MRWTGRNRFQWVIWFGVLAGVGAGMLVMRDRLDKAQVTLAFLLVVLWGSSSGGRALGVSLAGAAFLVFNWFFLPPYNTLVVAHSLDWLVLIVFLFTGITAAQLLERMRHQAALAERRADEIDRIATLGAESLNAPGAEDALDAIAAVIRAAMSVDECIIVLGPRGGEHAEDGSARVPERERNAGVLACTMDHGEVAAERADGTVALIGNAVHAPTAESTVVGPLTDIRALAVPLTVRDRVVGALRIAASVPFSLSEDQRRVLGALSYYAALGAERVRLTGAAEQAEALRRADRLKDSLLAAVSHDLRTPLTAIKGIANEVWRGGDPMRAATIEEEADHMNVLVEDLLQLSQINAGVMRMHIALNTVDDVVGPALERIEAAHVTERIHVQIDNEGGILAGEFDLANTTRALTNLLENAIKYSPPGMPIFLRVTREEARVSFAVEDAGHGVAIGDEERIFEPFFRGSQHRADGGRGTGLGLSIARQLIEAQGGHLTYERAGTGSRFVIDLPAATLMSP